MKATIQRCNYALLGIMIWSAFFVTLASSHDSRNSNRQNSSSDFQQDLARLDSLRQSEDLDSLEALISRDSIKWKKRDHNYYLKYMLEACSLLSSYDIGSLSKRALLLNRYATSVLKSGDMQINENIQFVEFLAWDPPVKDEAAWKSLREQKARLWLAAWRRIAGSIDPTFDLNDLSYINVPTPPGSAVPAGSSPESIKDPRLRAEYERAIDENSAKSLRYNAQYYLRQTAPRLYNEAERYLASAYARSPADLPELKRLLSQYISDPAVRNRILEEVRKGE